MTNPSPPSSPFEQVVEKITDFLDSVTEHEDREVAEGLAREALKIALDTGLLKLVEEQPEEWAPESEVLSTPVVIEAIKEGVREYETWKQSLEQPSSKHAPRTSKDLEQQDAEQPRGEPLDTRRFAQSSRQPGDHPQGEPSGLDGAEAHELYSMFLAHVCSSEFHPRHPLITGAKKLAAMLDEYHARFNEVLSDDDDPFAEQPRGEPSEVAKKLRKKAAFYRTEKLTWGWGGTADELEQVADEIAAIDNPSGEGPRCTCERGANLDHWSRCDVHRVERSTTPIDHPQDRE